MNMSKHLSKICFKILIVLVFVILANVAAGIFDRRWDVTSLRLHTLTPETRTFLSHLQQPVSLTVFYSGAAPRYLKDLLVRYEEASHGKITTEIIDPLVQLTYAARFGTNIDKNETKIFLRSATSSSELDFTGQVMTQDWLNFGILRLNRAEKTACFTSGHNEYKLDSDEPEGLRKLKNRLLAQHITAREIVLGMNHQIPEACHVLVIAGPHTQFSAEDEKTVRDYLSRGGDALILIENTVVTTPEIPLTPEQEELNPRLDAILNPWGLRVGKDIVVDLSSHISGDPGTPATRNYMKHSSLVKDLDYTFYVRPRSMSMIPDRRKDLKLAPFVLSSSQQSSWAESDRLLHVKFDAGADIPGPAVISYVAWGLRPDPKASDTRMIVFTDADFLSNAFIDQFSNGRMAMNIINWLVDPDFQSDLTSKDLKQTVERMDLTSAQKITTGAALAVMPLVIVLAGIMVLMRRRS